MPPRADPTRILPIPAALWPLPPAPVKVDGVYLQPKTELHLTLIGRALGRELQATFGEAAAGQIVASALAVCDWQFKRTGRLLLLRKPFAEAGHRGIAHALIERVDLPAMASLHAALGRRLGRQLPVPPAHVTLYVAGRETGIGVASERRLRACTQRAVRAEELVGAPTPVAG